MYVSVYSEDVGPLALGRGQEDARKKLNDSSLRR